MYIDVYIYVYIYMYIYISISAVSDAVSRGGGRKLPVSMPWLRWCWLLFTGLTNALAATRTLAHCVTMCGRWSNNASSCPLGSDSRIGCRWRYADDATEGGKGLRRFRSSMKAGLCLWMLIDLWSCGLLAGSIRTFASPCSVYFVFGKILRWTLWTRAIRGAYKLCKVRADCSHHPGESRPSAAV